MATLYRKYRPQTFAEISGQEHVKLTLAYEIKAGQVAHAYLFCGPRAIGKTTIARLMAKSMNCVNRKDDEADPCNTCSSCLEITEGRSMDVAEIDAASHTSVDHVREAIIASSRLAASGGRYKVFIIDEAHMLSTSAWNALLKTMEEPPARVMFILCTTEAHKVPPTIVSRCQRFDFKKIGIAEIIAKLSRIIREEKIKVGPGVLEAVARHANGHMRDAESLLGQVIALGGKDSSPKGKEITLDEAELVIPRSYVNEAADLLEYLAAKDAGQAVSFINRLADNGADLKVFANEVVDIARRLLLAKVSAELGAALRHELGEAVEARLEPVVAKLEADVLSATIERFIIAARDIKDAPVPQLPLELATIDICFGKLFSAESISSPLIPRPAAARPAAAPAASMRARASVSSPEPVQAAVNLNNAGIEPEDVSAAWEELLSRVKVNNHSLSFVLRSCQVIGADGSTVRLAFKHKFHHDRLNEPAIRQLVENLLGDIMGKRVAIATTLDPNLVLVENTKSDGETAPSTVSVADVAVVAANIDSSVIDNLLKTFGGKVVS